MSKEALEGSIKKWKRIVNNRRFMDKGISNCPLCKKYFAGNGEKCKNCPVFIETGISNCDGTPYMEWLEHQYMSHGRGIEPYRRQKDCPECLCIAKAELAFLESLREIKGA